MRNNNFKHIEPENELPAHVKKETLSNLDTLRLVLDMVDLFCLKANGVWVRSLSTEPGMTRDGGSVMRTFNLMKISYFVEFFPGKTEKIIAKSPFIPLKLLV